MISHQIQNPKNSRLRLIAWMVWLIASIFYAYQYVLRVMPNIMMGDLMQQFNFDSAGFGQFSGIYYLGYALMHLPIGILLDRYGPRKIMTVCLLISVLGLLPIIFLTGWVYALMGRLLIGMGSSAAILGLFKVTRMIFKETQFTRMISLSVMIGLMGAIYGGGPVRYLCDTWGYQSVVILFAGVGLLLAGLTYWIVPELEKTSKQAVWAEIKMVLSNSKVIWACIFAGCMVGPLEGFADVWGGAFLKQIYGLEPSMAASLSSMIFIGMCFGSPVLSFFGEKTNYLGTIIGAGLLMMFSFMLLITGQLSNSLIGVLFIGVGVACSYQILAIYKASTYVPAQAAGLTTAVANMIIMSFGYAFHSMIGLVVDFNGGPEVNIALIYGVSVIPVALLFGIIGFSGLLYKELAKREILC